MRELTYANAIREATDFCLKEDQSVLVVGLGVPIVFQAFINIGVTVQLFPVTGQTLPLISKGGTSIIFTCIAIGIILSISKNTEDRDYEKA